MPSLIFEYTYSNKIGLSYLKLSAEMLQKICISDTPSLPDEMRQKVLSEMIHVYNTGETVLVDMYNPVINKYGNVYRIKFRDGVLTTIQDKTTEQLAIQQLNEKASELERSNANLKEFAYAASHDLQEPLRKITSFSDRLRTELNGMLSDAQQNIFDRLYSASGRMQQLMDDLLSYSALITRKDTKEKVGMQTIVHDVVQDLETSIADAGVDLQIGSLPFVYGYAGQLRQLFQNLISNAIKYRRKEIIPLIKISCCHIEPGSPLLESNKTIKNSSYYLIEVKDNGIGFEPEYSEKIFQIFQRLHGRSEYEGTGIGLSIVQKVVSNHNGFIKAIGEPGEGSTFHVFLPAR